MTARRVMALQNWSLDFAADAMPVSLSLLSAVFRGCSVHFFHV